jgi:hypothetical protein
LRCPSREIQVDPRIDDAVFDRQMKIAMRLLDAVHFRCLNARGTLFTV